MLKVAQLLKFIADMNPQNTPTRLCFYNFLRSIPHPEDALTKELIEMFFNYCMDYPHWVANKVQLGNEIKYILDHFNSFFQQRFDISKIRFPQNMQIIELEGVNDQIDAVNCYLTSICGPEDKFRVIPDPNRRMISVIMREDRSIEVRVFDKKFTVRQGFLEPLRRDLVLYYTPELELSPTHIHRIDVAPYVTTQFTCVDNRIQGVLLRGYVFQKLQDYRGEELKELTRLHYAVKRFEQFFIDRRTDVYYQDLVHQLERTRSLVQQSDPEAQKWSHLILSQAETALENVYIGDKFLSLLIRDLKFSLNTPPSLIK